MRGFVPLDGQSIRRRGSCPGVDAKVPPVGFAGRSPRVLGIMRTALGISLRLDEPDRKQAGERAEALP